MGEKNNELIQKIYNELIEYRKELFETRDEFRKGFKMINESIDGFETKTKSIRKTIDDFSN